MRHLVREPLDLVQLMRQASHPAGQTGAWVNFCGVVRADQDDQGRIVAGLEYDAYEAMAQQHIERILVLVRRRWVLEAVHVEHRLGFVAVGQTALWAAVSASHRLEAFEASRELIEVIKQEVPIWKKIHYADGTSCWQMQTMDPLPCLPMNPR